MANVWVFTDRTSTLRSFKLPSPGRSKAFIRSSGGSAFRLPRLRAELGERWATSTAELLNDILWNEEKNCPLVEGLIISVSSYPLIGIDWRSARDRLIHDLLSPELTRILFSVEDTIYEGNTGLNEILSRGRYPNIPLKSEQEVCAYQFLEIISSYCRKYSLLCLESFQG